MSIVGCHHEGKIVIVGWKTAQKLAQKDRFRGPLLGWDFFGDGILVGVACGDCFTWLSRDDLRLANFRKDWRAREVLP